MHFLKSKSSAKTSSARPCPGDVEHQLQELEHQLQCIAQAEEREKGRSSPRSPAAAMERSRPRAKTATGQVPQGTLARAETRRRRSEGDARTLRPEVGGFEDLFCASPGYFGLLSCPMHGKS
eukprot:s2175_g4.t1